MWREIGVWGGNGSVWREIKCVEGDGVCGGRLSVWREMSVWRVEECVKRQRGSECVEEMGVCGGYGSV